MGKISDPPEPGSKGVRAGDPGREARLAQALRTNLRRRKDAARSEAKPPEPSGSE